MMRLDDQDFDELVEIALERQNARPLIALYETYRVQGYTDSEIYNAWLYNVSVESWAVHERNGVAPTDGIPGKWMRACEQAAGGDGPILEPWEMPQ